MRCEQSSQGEDVRTRSGFPPPPAVIVGGTASWPIIFPLSSKVAESFLNRWRSSGPAIVCCLFATAARDGSRGACAYLWWPFVLYGHLTCRVFEKPTPFVPDSCRAVYATTGDRFFLCVWCKTSVGSVRAGVSADPSSEDATCRIIKAKIVLLIFVVALSASVGRCASPFWFFSAFRTCVACRRRVRRVSRSSTVRFLVPLKLGVFCVCQCAVYRWIGCCEAVDVLLLCLLGGPGDIYVYNYYTFCIFVPIWRVVIFFLYSHISLYYLLLL